MATPEQNALLALQLFGAPAQQFNQQNDARTNLSFKIAQLQREEQLKRDLATQGYDKSIELANMQGVRDDKRNQTTLDWHKLQGDQNLKRDEARATESERKQTAAIEARDKQMVIAEMNRLYPQYAQAARRGGETPRPRTDYPETNEGLGQLAADARTAEVGFEEKKQKGAALALVGGLDEAVTAVDAIKSRITELAKPLPQELKVARAQAVKALQAAIEQKTLASAEKLRPAAIKKGLAHLAAGEDALASELLGAEAFTAFENALETTLLGLDSRKSAMQQSSQLNQQLLQVQSHAAREKAEVTKAAGGNPFVADELVKRRTSFQRLMAPMEEPKRRRSFEEVTPAPGTAGAAAPATVVPNPAASASPNTDRALTRLQELGLFQRPMVQQGRASVFSPTTPDMIESARGNLVGEIGRTQSLGSRGAQTRLQLLQSLLSQLPPEPVPGPYLVDDRRPEDDPRPETDALRAQGLFVSPEEAAMQFILGAGRR